MLKQDSGSNKDISFSNHPVDSKETVTINKTSDKYKFDAAMQLEVGNSEGKGRLLISEDGLSVNNRRKKRSIEAEFTAIRDLLLHKYEGQAKTRISTFKESNDINYTDSDGKTILHYACEYQCKNIVGFLLGEDNVNKGLKLNIQDKNGDTPLMIAARKGYSDIAIMLAEDMSVEVNNQLKVRKGHTVEEGDTALSIAVKNKNVEIVRAIMNKKTLDSHEQADLSLKINQNRSTVLHLIARGEGTLEIAKIILSEGTITTLKLGNMDGLTPLHVAVKHDNLEVVELLVKHFPDLIKKEKILTVKEKRRDKNTPLHDAIKHKNIEILRLLLTVATKEDLEVKNKSEKTPYELIKEIVIEAGEGIVPDINHITDEDIDNNQGIPDLKLKLQMLQMMQEKQREVGIEVAVSIDPKSPQNHESYKGLLDDIKEYRDDRAISKIEQIIAAGYDINLLDSEGYAILHRACQSILNPVILFLLKNDASPNIVVSDTRDTPLMIVASQPQADDSNILGSTIATKDLIEKKADVNKQNNNLETALSIAIEARNIPLVRLLVEIKEANLNLKVNKNRSTVLHLIARGEGILEIAKIILSEGAITTIKLRDKNGLTPLHVAVKHNNLEVVRLLVSRFPNLIKAEKILTIQENRINKNTPLYDAIKYKNVEILKLLLTVATKEDLEIKNAKGDTLIDLIGQVRDPNTIALREAYQDFTSRSNTNNQQETVPVLQIDISEVSIEVFRNMVSEMSAEDLNVKTLDDSIGEVNDENIRNQMYRILEGRRAELGITTLHDRICDAIEKKDLETLKGLLLQATLDDLLYNMSDNSRRSVMDLVSQLGKEHTQIVQMVNDNLGRLNREAQSYLGTSGHYVPSAIDQQEAGSSLGGNDSCLPAKRPRLSKRELRSKCLLAEDEEGKVDKEKTGIDVNEENLAESKIDNEKLKVYQDDLNNRLVAASDESSQHLIKEEQSQLNKLILEIQQAQAIRDFHIFSREVDEKLLPAFRDNGDISPESLQYFEQIIKINLLRIVSPLIRSEKFKELLLNNPEKFGQVLDNIFVGIKGAISNEYKERLSYEDFENIENEINEQISHVEVEIESLVDQNVNKSHLLNYVFMSMGLSRLLADTDASADLKNRISYEALVALGALIHDHENHIKANHHGHEHNPHMSALNDRMGKSELLAVAHDLHKLHKGNVNQNELKSKVIKAKIDSYGSIDSNYIINDLLNKFSSEEIENIFNKENISAELKAYEKEVITIHSKQIKTSHAAIQIGISGNDKNIVIDNIEDIKNPSNLKLDEKNLAITLKLGNKEYLVIIGQEDKYYLNVEGYKAKIGDLISSFTSEEKNNIHDRLEYLQERVEVLESKRDIESIAEMSDPKTDEIINEIKRNFLKQGVIEETWNQFDKKLESLSEKIYTEYVNTIEKDLAKNNIKFDRSKFALAKIKGTKSNKFFSIMAIYDLFDSTADLKGLGDSPLNTIFGINGIFDAMDDVRESLSTQYASSDDGKIKTRLSRSGLGKITSKIPAEIRKGFVRMINNPVVQGITFITVAWQFGHSIDQIIKGENVELNAYFTTSSGIKLVSMSMKPVSMGVTALTRSISISIKAPLRVLSTASKILGKLSIVTVGLDFVVTIGIAIHERIEYTKAVAEQIPLLPGDEQAEVFFAKAIKFFGGRDVEQEYEGILSAKGYLENIKATIVKLFLEKFYDTAAVVQYAPNIEEKYDEIILHEKRDCGKGFIGLRTGHSANCDILCPVERVNLNVFLHDNIVKATQNLSLLNISDTLPLTLHTLVMTKWWEEFVCNTKIPSSNRDKCHKELGDKQAYFVDLSKKHLPSITLSEYSNGLRIISAPLNLFQDHKEYAKNQLYHRYMDQGQLVDKCNTNKIYKSYEKKYTFSNEPFIFTKIGNNPKGKIVYLPGPKRLIAAANYPAVMYVPKANSNDGICHTGSNVWKGSKNHESTFIVSDGNTTGTIIGGKAKVEKNILAMNADLNHITVDLNRGKIYYDAPKCLITTINEMGEMLPPAYTEVVFPNIELKNVYNYVSNTTAQQSIITDCKTRYVSAGGGSRGNTVRQGSTNCKDEDHEVRVVHKNDVHYRGTKQAIFVVNRDSNNATITVDNNFNINKNNTDIIRLEGLGIERLRIKEAEGYYNLTLLTDGEQAISIKVVNDLTNLAIYTEENQTIVVQDKSLLDLARDMSYQKLNRSGEYIDDRILENSETKLKAVILQEIDYIENTPHTAKNVADKSNNLGMPLQVVVTEYREKELVERAIIHNTYSKDIYVDLFASGDFKFGYPFSYVESIKIKDENTTTFSFLDGFKVHLNRNEYDITGYVFNETRSVSDIITGGDYQDIVNELNTTIPIKFSDEVMIIGTKGDDILHNNPNYKTHLVGSGGKDKYVIDINLSNSSIPEVTIYDPNNPTVDMSYLKKKLKDKLGIDFTLQQWFNRNADIIFDSKISDKIFSRINIKQCKLKSIDNLVPFSEDMSSISVTCGFNRKLLHITRENILSHLDSNNWDPQNLLTDYNTDISAQDNQGNTALHFACKNCNYNVAKYLIEEKNARINVKNKDGKIPLDLANECQQSKKEQIIELFRKAQLRLDELLLINVSDGNLAEVRSLISRGANLDIRNRGYTLLHHAVENGHLEVARYFIERGVNINVIGAFKIIPLHLAAKKGNLKVVEYLIENGAKSNARCCPSGQTPLHFAVKRDYLKVAKYLVKNGADIKAQHFLDMTPLEIAISKGDSNLVEILNKEYQLYLDKQLLVATEKGDLNRVKGLHGKGANINSRDNYNSTPLHLAVEEGYSSIVRYLVENGADIHAKDTDGKTPLDFAKGHTDIENYLRKKAERERPVERKRRATNLDEKIKQQEVSAASSIGARQTSLIGEGIAWMKHLVSKLFAESTSDLSVTPNELLISRDVYQHGHVCRGNEDININQHNDQSKMLSTNVNQRQQRFDNSQSFILSTQVDIKGGLFMADILVRNRTGTHYKKPVDNSLKSPIEQSMALNISYERCLAIERAMNGEWSPNNNLINVSISNSSLIKNRG